MAEETDDISIKVAIDTADADKSIKEIKQSLKDLKNVKAGDKLFDDAQKAATKYKEKLDDIKDFLKKIRDSGLQVGVSTHMPDVIEYIEDKNWDIDFYMACVYERHRSEADLRKLLGYVPLPVGEVYLEEDPPRMFKMIQQTEKTCLAFKILAAGRVCDRAHLLERAFENTFSNIKAKDAVIVGMFPRWSDQIKENADLVRQFG